MSGKKYVPDGVWLTCSCGTCFSVFKVTFHKMTDIYGSNMATEGDRWPYLNIKPMGMCTTLRCLCTPSPVIWQNPKQGVLIGTNRMLLEDSTAMCMFGGTIRIHFTLEAAQAACPFGSFKKPSEYIKDGFDWVFNKMDNALSDVRTSLAKAGTPNWLLNGVEQIAWVAQFQAGVVEGSINAVVGLGEVVWDITQDPVGVGTAIVEGVADGATSAWAWASKGENWTNTAESSWDYVTSPDKWAETADDAAAWLQDNPRTAGNVAGEIVETVAEIALTAGTATAAKAGGKVAGEIVENVVEKGAKEATEKATKEIAEKGAKEAAESSVQKSLPKVITKEAIDNLVQKSKSAFDRALKEKDKLTPSSKYKNKTVASDSIKSVSGWTDTEGFTKIKPSEVKQYSNEIGHTPKRGGSSDYAGKEAGFDGKYNSSHAEKKILSEKPNEPIGVTQPMCKDCQNFCSKQAGKTQNPVVVTDPKYTRVFMPDGSIDVY